MDTKRCPICGAGNSKIAKFCYACGADLRTEAPQTVQSVVETTAAESVQEQSVSAHQGYEQNPGPEAQRNESASAPGSSQQYQPGNGQMPPQTGYVQQGGYQAPPPIYQQPGYQPPPVNPYQPYQPYGGPMPPQNPYMPPMVPLGYSQKSKLAAGIMGILVGIFGVHNFYLGYTGKAVAQLLLTLLGSIITCGLAAVAVWIWSLVEGIMILTGGIKVDGHNVPLSD